MPSGLEPGKQTSVECVYNPYFGPDSLEIFSPDAPEETRQGWGLEYIRLCRTYLMRVAEPADAVIAEGLFSLGPAITAHLLAHGGPVPAQVWDSGETDPVLGRILLERMPLYTPGEHSMTLEEFSRTFATRRKRWQRRALAVVRECELAIECGVWLAIPEDNDYPGGLTDLGPKMPYGLWGTGERGRLGWLARQQQRSIAFVGSRDATQYGQSATARLAGELAENGCIIISGGAYGIDIVAHRAGLGAGVGKVPTVALMAGGLDHFYPAQNAQTLRVIARDGLVLSEVSIGNTPTRWRFLERNRLIAALAGHTVVAEARWRSGALNTAHHALELGREVWAIPGQVDSPNSVGTNRLIRDSHARILIDTADIIEAEEGFNAEREEPIVDRNSALDALSPAQGRLWDTLGLRTYRTVDTIASRVGLPARTVMLELAALDRCGLAQTDGVGWRKINPKP